MLRFFFAPTKKMSVFRTRLSRANCAFANANPAKREREVAPLRDHAKRKQRSATTQLHQCFANNEASRNTQQRKREREREGGLSSR